MKRFFSNPVVVLLAGACLRLLFVIKFPARTGDAMLYDQLATNWLKLGKLAMDIGGVPTPADLRMPGYPGFLAVIYAITRRSGEAAGRPVMLAQVVVDLAACLVIAALAALLARVAGQQEKAKRVFTVALWLAALCPLTANYVAVPLTETWAVFLSTVAYVPLTMLGVLASGNPALALGMREFKRKDMWKLGLIAGIAVGVGTLFRPEAPLLLVTTGAVLALWMWPRGEIKRWLWVCALMGTACAAVLLPWTIRNAVTLHEFQPLVPQDTTLPSEVDPKGLMAWESTWLYRMRDVYLVAWKLNEEEIHMEDIPARAFDTDEERERVAMVLERYNDELTWTKEEDATFAQLARERTARHPLRTYVWVPLNRVLAIWFTPRIELLPIAGHVFPLAYQHEEDPVDQRMTILIFFANLAYVALGLWGAWKLWRQPGARAAVVVLMFYAMVRTAFLTTQEAPEPRYVLVCFPALIACAAQITWREGDK